MKWSVQLRNCPPGLFLFNDTLCFKAEYKTQSNSWERSYAQTFIWQSDAYVVASGEYFWGGTDDPVKRENLPVTPVGCGDRKPRNVVGYLFIEGDETEEEPTT